MRLIDADALDKRIYNDIPIKVFGSIKNMAAVRQIVEEAPTVCKWHDPDEELPEKDGEYLCLYPVKTIPPHWGIAIYEWRGKYFYCHDTEWGDAMVTGMYYWMEIPPMPRMKGADDAAD